MPPRGKSRKFSEPGGQGQPAVNVGIIRFVICNHKILGLLFRVMESSELNQLEAMEIMEWLREGKWGSSKN